MRTRIGGWRGPGASVLACAIAACEPTPCVEVPCLSDAEPISRDAGLDAFAPDARRAPIDAGRDAAPYGEERWAVAATLADGCVMEAALNPSSLPIETRWESCGDGCSRWTGARIGWGERTDGGLVWVEARPIVALLDLATGQWRHALRITHGACGIFGRFDGERAVLAVFHRTGAATDWLRTFDVRDGDPAPRVAFHVELPSPIGWPTLVQVGGGRWAFAMDGSAWSFDSARAPTALDPGSEGEPFVDLHDDEVLFVRHGATTDEDTTFAVSPPRDAARPLHRAAGIVRDVALDDATLAWTETFLEGVPDRVELWTATYFDGAFTARLVRELPAGDRAALGGGLYARVEQPFDLGAPRVAVYRLSDGASAMLPLPVGTAAYRVAYVRPDEILVEGALTVRIDPRTLVFE